MNIGYGFQGTVPPELAGVQSYEETIHENDNSSIDLNILQSTMGNKKNGLLIERTKLEFSMIHSFANTNKVESEIHFFYLENKVEAVGEILLHFQLVNAYNHLLTLFFLDSNTDKQAASMRGGITRPQRINVR